MLERVLPAQGSCLCPIALGLLHGGLGRRQCSNVSSQGKTHHAQAARGTGASPASTAARAASRRRRTGGWWDSMSALSSEVCSAASVSPGSSFCPAGRTRGLAPLGGRAEICPRVSQPHHQCIGCVLCPHAATLGTGGCLLLLRPGWMLYPSVCPGRKRLKCQDFLAVMLGREGDLQKCFASSVTPAGLAKCCASVRSCWSETELETQLEFGLSRQNLSPGLNVSFPLPHRGQLSLDVASFPLWCPAPGLAAAFGVPPCARQ